MSMMTYTEMMRTLRIQTTTTLFKIIVISGASLLGSILLLMLKGPIQSNVSLSAIRG